MLAEDFLDSFAKDRDLDAFRDISTRRDSLRSSVTCRSSYYALLDHPNGPCNLLLASTDANRWANHRSLAKLLDDVRV